MTRRALNHPGQSQLYPLFARANRTGTSRRAAAAAEPRCPSQRDRVLEMLSHFGIMGCTQSRLSQLLGIPLQSVCARVSELGEMGSVVALTEERETAAGGSGLVFVTRENVNGRPLADWPPPKVNWKARAIAAEARVAHLERLLGQGARQ